ncbi:MAG: glycoside-pentoside-hexuronide (GPH):cation symporter [Oscillospiraceae bacterium]|nr:glycoside-pentoside-hexuronide (GPH):cation symporter [Oscillospiraceae bacterium]
MEQTTHQLPLSEKIGYALGDTGGQLFLGLINTFLQQFYMNVLRIPARQLTWFFGFLRIWDGINDPLLGTLIDRRRPGKHGKFRPYLRNFSIPFALAGVLLFTRVPGLSPLQYLIYAYITHVLYEIIFTAINIPLGSMASVITMDGDERSKLSTFRSLGAGLGNLPASVILPMFVFGTMMYQGEEVQVLDYRNFFIAVVVFAVLSVVIHNVAFGMTREHVPPPPKEQTHDIRHTLRVLVKNRSFMAICMASMLIMGATMFTQAVHGFLFLNYFGNPQLLTFVTIATHAPTVLLLPVLQKMVRRFGKKQLCAWGLALAAAANFVLLALRTTNPWVFIGMCFVSGIGITFLNMQLWALLTDVLDKQELMSKKREEGTCYAMFFATRKLGHTAAGVGSSALLDAIGYVEGAPVQPVPVVGRLYIVATLVPAIAFLLNFLTMQFWYPFSKRDEEEIRAELAEQRAQQEETVNA